MTSANFIRNGQPGLCTMEAATEFFNVLESECAEFDNIYYSANVKNDMNNFDDLFKESSDENTEVFTEGTVTNLISKLGELIKKLFQRLIDLVTAGINKIRDFSFRMKSAEKKIDMLLKRYPDLKNEKMFSIDQVRFNDLKAIADLDKEHDRIMALIDMKKNPKGLRNRWKKAIQKFNDGEGMFNTVINVAKGVNTIVVAVVAIASLRNNIHKVNTELNDRKAKVKKSKILAEKNVDEIQMTVNKKNSNGSSSSFTTTEYVDKSSGKLLKGRAKESIEKLINESAELSNDELAENARFIQEMTRDYTSINAKYCSWKVRNMNQMIHEVESYCDSHLKEGEKDD